MHKSLFYLLGALILGLLLALSWYGWSQSGLSLQQLNGFFC